MPKYVLAYTISGRPRKETEAEKLNRVQQTGRAIFRTLMEVGDPWSVFGNVVFFSTDQTRDQVSKRLKTHVTDGDTFFLVSFDEPDVANFLGWLPNADECGGLFPRIIDMN